MENQVISQQSELKFIWTRVTSGRTLFNLRQLEDFDTFDRLSARRRCARVYVRTYVPSLKVVSQRVDKVVHGKDNVPAGLKDFLLPPAGGRSSAGSFVCRFCPRPYLRCVGGSTSTGTQSDDPGASPKRNECKFN